MANHIQSSVFDMRFRPLLDRTIHARSPRCSAKAATLSRIESDATFDQAVECTFIPLASQRGQCQSLEEDALSVVVGRDDCVEFIAVASLEASMRQKENAAVSGHSRIRRIRCPRMA